MIVAAFRWSLCLRSTRLQSRCVDEKMLGLCAITDAMNITTAAWEQHPTKRSPIGHWFPRDGPQYQHFKCCMDGSTNPLKYIEVRYSYWARQLNDHCHLSRTLWRVIFVHQPGCINCGLLSYLRQNIAKIPLISQRKCRERKILRYKSIENTKCLYSVLDCEWLRQVFKIFLWNFIHTCLWKWYVQVNLIFKIFIMVFVTMF